MMNTKRCGIDRISSLPNEILMYILSFLSTRKVKEMNTKRCGVDRISSLPDEILTYILSFLSTRKAMQTYILSKRWTNTWASVPILEFDIDELMPKIVDGKMVVKFVPKFELLVKSVLEKRDTSCVINRFRLWLDCGVYLPCTLVVANCISDAMKLKPRECSIKWRSCAHLNLNTDLIFTCASLIDLQLWVFRNVAIKPNSINLPCLKTLNLTGRVNDDFFKKLFLGCPVFEELVLSCSMGIVELCSNTLKKLIIRDWYERNRLQISMPNLLYFEIHIVDIYPIMDIGEILMLNMPSLVDAFISVHCWYYGDDYISGVPKLIASFSNLESLKLQFGRTDEKALKKELSNCPVFSNLKCLTLVSLGFYVFDLAPFFLHHSPRLQELTLQNIYNKAWTAIPEGPSDALVQREFLKTVKIVGFKNENEFVDLLINKLFVNVKIISEIMHV